MSANMQRAWVLSAAPGELDAALTSFIARKLMKITQRRDGMIEVTAGSTLAIDLGGTLDWLPVRARIWRCPEREERTRVQAQIRPRGRPRLVRRGQIRRLYKTKMSSWLAQLDETLRATGVQVQEVPPVPAATLKAS
jgi:hypothetical protein